MKRITIAAVTAKQKYRAESGMSIPRGRAFRIRPGPGRAKRTRMAKKSIPEIFPILRMPPVATGRKNQIVNISPIITRKLRIKFMSGSPVDLRNGAGTVLYSSICAEECQVLR